MGTVQVILYGGLFDRVRVYLAATPKRIEVGGVLYTQVTDPDTGEFLGAYIAAPPPTPGGAM